MKQPGREKIDNIQSNKTSPKTLHKHEKEISRKMEIYMLNQKNDIWGKWSNFQDIQSRPRAYY